MKDIDDEQNNVIHKKMPPQRQESIHTEHDDAQIAPNDSADLEFKISLDCKRFTYLAFFLAVIFPLLPFLLASIFGGLLALFEEDADFRKGFLYVVSNLLGMANPLTSYSPSGATAAIIIDIYVSVTALICFGIMLNVVNLFQIPLAMNDLIKRCVTNPIIVTVIALGILIPAFTAVMSVLFGCLLALAEDWTVKDGIFYVFSNALGLGTPLTDMNPTTIGGALLDIIISSAALGYFAIFADYVTVLNPSKAIRAKFRQSLGRMGVIDLSNTPSLHPLDYDNVQDQVEHSTYSDNSGEIETSTYESKQLESCLDNLTLPRPPSETNLNDNDKTAI